MPSSKRRSRVAEQLHEVLSILLEFEVSDPRIAGVTVVGVDVDRELMYATVYVNAYDEEPAEVLRALDHAAPYLRRQVAQQVQLQHAPELRFRWDDTLERAHRIDALLDSLSGSPAEETNSEDERGDSPVE